jgi:hypothetical protein
MSTKTLAWTRRYIERGYAPIPVPAGEKNPGRPGWEALRITEEEIPNYWTNGQNVGLLCGKPSDDRVDVDLDASEAVKIAFRFLPETLTSGRKSRPHSHLWYVALGAENRDWKDTDGSKLVELRSTGRQTLVAPSIHPDGDEYVWHAETGLKMAEIGAAELTRRLRELATATLIARHFAPERGAVDATTMRSPWLASCSTPAALARTLPSRSSRPHGMRRDGPAREKGGKLTGISKGL